LRLFEVSRTKVRAAVVGLKRQTIVSAVGLLTLVGCGFGPGAYGQAIAYIPVPGFIPTGSTLTVTPAVSPDRRYVRLTVSPFFNTLNGFQNFTTQLGAVGGGGGGALAGMNGLIGQGAGGAVGNGLGQGTMAGQSDYPLAGPYSLGGEIGAADPFALESASEPAESPRFDSELGVATDQAATSDVAPAVSQTGRKNGRTAAKSSSSARKSIPKPAQKSGSGSRRRSYVRSIDPFVNFE
jgi:hypothetical protein